MVSGERCAERHAGKVGQRTYFVATHHFRWRIVPVIVRSIVSENGRGRCGGVSACKMGGGSSGATSASGVGDEVYNKAYVLGPMESLVDFVEVFRLHHVSWAVVYDIHLSAVFAQQIGFIDVSSHGGFG